MAETKIAKATFMVTGILLVGRVLGFLREMTIASFLGASSNADAYFIAFSVPNVLINVLALGAISSAIIPVVSKYVVNKEHEKINKLTNTLYTLIILLLSVITVVGIYYAPVLVKVMAPGFDKGTFDFSVHLTRIMMPTMIFLGLVGVSKAVLNAYDHYFTPAFTNIVFNLAVIIISYLWINVYGADALAYAVLVGAFLQFFFQYTKLRSLNYKTRISLDFDNEDIKKIFTLMVPIVIGMVITQLNVIINKAVASGLGEGSISALNYADKIIQLPMGIFVGAIVTTTFPNISRFVQVKDYQALRQVIGVSAKTIFILFGPLIVLLVFLSKPIINVLFERNAFSAADTLLTAQALEFYAIGLISLAMVQVLTKIFHAYQETRTPVFIGAVSIILHIVLNLTLADLLGHRGVALATSVSATVNSILLYYLLIKKHGEARLSLSIGLVVKTFSGLILLAVVSATFSEFYMSSLLNSLGLIRLFAITLFGGAALVLYFAFLKLLKVDEVQKIEEMLSAKIIRKFKRKGK